MLMDNMINLDYQSREPIFKQIVMQIERYVALGILKPNDTLPSIRKMATSLGINPNTVKKAYAELESRGVISTLSTKNTFVSGEADNIKKQKIAEGIEKLKKEIDELVVLGISKEELIERIRN